MHRKLPFNMNIQIFSFFSQLELRRHKVISKECQQAIEHPVIWESLTKRDFFIRKEKHKDYSEALYDKYLTRMEEESAVFLECAVPYIYSFQVKLQNNIWYRPSRAVNEYNYNWRTRSLDDALFKGISEFRKKHELLYERKLFVDEMMIRSYAMDFIEGVTSLESDSQSSFLERLQNAWIKNNENKEDSDLSNANQINSILMLMLPKIDAHIILHRILHASHMPQVCLDEMLHIACQFMHQNTVELLLKFGANPNAPRLLKLGIDSLHSVPLFQVFVTALGNNLPYERYHSIFQLLLDGGADPDQAFPPEARKSDSAFRQYCHTVYVNLDCSPQLLETVMGMSQKQAVTFRCS